MDGLEEIKQQMLEIQNQLSNEKDMDVRRNLWLQFNELYLKFLEVVL